MDTILTNVTRGLACVLAIAALSLNMTGPAHAQELPDLSSELKKIIDKDGVEAGKKFFADVFPAKIDKYAIDQQTFGQLGSAYMQAGNMEAGLAVSEMFAAVIQVTAKDMVPPQVARMLEEAEKQEAAEKAQRAEAEMKAKAEAKAEAKADYNERMGPTRDDLDRFRGMYGDPEGRRLWVSKTCAGRLVVGAYWGDAVPWYLKSEGESYFSQKDENNNIKMSFENDGSGRAITMIHSFDFLPGELPRVADLPSDWKDCIVTGQ